MVNKDSNFPVHPFRKVQNGFESHFLKNFNEIILSKHLKKSMVLQILKTDHCSHSDEFLNFLLQFFVIRHSEEKLC